ncbi:dimethyl sulfoxide reductase anchor subunit family protein [Tenebrionicola larvae]|uniref:Dimethyl sulfoxide reductase anchor subunit n=1 Tax=Tenebrionicola larvae TaxID=2815733 RepID=A0A949V5K5_9ENTR|nr:DmsC/YnfH family molybdoenzyme membrane anchor subunit [Tenebrionicola larvae]MBV5097429.1 dimethyl sulfoxide reductase anchor subunit [Tenebrionicola larvae]
MPVFFHPPITGDSSVLVQGSVSLTLFLTLNARSAKRDPQVKSQLLPVMLAACIAGGLGLIASTLHLGYPLNAFNALRHVASSWLSREIVFASLYLAVLGLCTLIMLVKKQLVSILLPVAALLGLIDVWCMSAIYANSSVVTWTHFNTWLMFYGTVGISGAVALAWLAPGKTPCVASGGKPALRLAGALVVAIVAIRLLAQPEYMSYLASTRLSGIVTLPHRPLDAFNQLSGLRLFTWIISTLGAILFALSAWRCRRAGLVVASLFLVASEVLFRFIFFSIH